MQMFKDAVPNQLLMPILATLLVFFSAGARAISSLLLLGYLLFLVAALILQWYAVCIKRAAVIARIEAIRGALSSDRF
jgi:hypothetical protein